jgi:hypothetical protein
MKPKDYAALLGADGGFDREDSVAVTFTYDYADPSLAQLREKYGLAAVAGEGDTQGRAIRLLHWLCARSRHSNEFSVDKQDSLSLLDYVIGTGGGLNCKYLSVLLSEICLCVGIKARILWLMPRDPKDRDCHAVVMACAPERRKWIFLDPTSNAYFSDAEGGVLSPMELREALAQGRELALNPESKANYDWYRDYLAKDMFYFESLKDTGFGALDHACVSVQLCPAAFDLAAWWANKLKEKKNSWYKPKEFIFATPESFWAID